MITAPLDPNAIPFEAGMMIGHNSNPPQRVVSARGGGAILETFVCLRASFAVPSFMEWHDHQVRPGSATRDLFTTLY